MAIARIKKIEIIGLTREKDKVLSLLQRLGSVELIAAQAKGVPGPCAPVHIAEVEETIAFLRSFQPTPGMLESIVKLKPLVYRDELQRILGEFDYAGLIKELSKLRTHLKHLLQQKEKLLQERQLLSPWQSLSVGLEELRDTRECIVTLGVLGSEDYETLSQECLKAGIPLWCQRVHADSTNVFLALIFLKDHFERLEGILKALHFSFVALPRHKGSVKDRVLEINREVLVLDDQIADTRARIAGFSGEQFKLMAVYDALAVALGREEAGSRCLAQQFTFLLSGWIKKRDLALLERSFKAQGLAVALFVSDPPEEGADIPIALENRPLVQPFEVVTDLYGKPVYGGLDPTGFLAPFFILSFGFCLLDAGYGLVLALSVAYFLGKKQISGHAKRFLRLFLYAGLTAIGAGLVTGSFFGDLLSQLPAGFGFLRKAQQRLVLFDPVKDSLVFLGLTLALGFVQIWIGVLIKFVRDLRRDRFSAFILDLPTLLIQTSLLSLVLVFAGTLPAVFLRVALAILALAASLEVYYQWRSNKEMSLKIFWSVFGIYSIVTGNFLADTLSFSRIFALGLTGGLLGMAMNTMLLPKGPVAGPLGLVGAIVAVAALGAGHLINLAISILGAYVHTSRLQYLEFFTKFFESGGRPFKPFKEETRYIFLADNRNVV